MSKLSEALSVGDPVARRFLVRKVNSISVLRANTISLSSTVYVQGYASVNDGGQGTFDILAGDSSTADDGGITIVDAVGNRWRRRLVNGQVAPQFFGAKGDGVTDDTAAFNALNAYLQTTPSTILLWAPNFFLLQTFDLPKGCSIIGVGDNVITMQQVSSYSAKPLLTVNYGATTPSNGGKVFNSYINNIFLKILNTNAPAFQVNYSSYITIRSLKTLGGSIGAQFIQCQDSYIENLTCDNAAVGVSIEVGAADSSNNLTFNKVTCETSSGRGMQIIGSGGAFVATSPNNINITALKIENGGASPTSNEFLYLSNVNGVRFYGPLLAIDAAGVTLPSTMAAIRMSNVLNVGIYGGQVQLNGGTTAIQCFIAADSGTGISCKGVFIDGIGIYNTASVPTTSGIFCLVSGNLSNSLIRLADNSSPSGQIRFSYTGANVTNSLFYGENGRLYSNMVISGVEGAASSQDLYFFNGDGSHNFAIGQLDNNGTFQFIRDGTTLAQILSNGSIDLLTVGATLRIKEGTNCKQGTGTLVNGTVTISTNAISASSRVHVTRTSPNSSTAIGEFSVSIVASTSFTVTSLTSTNTTATGDQSSFCYTIFDPG